MITKNFAFIMIDYIVIADLYKLICID